jgi:transposase
MKRPKRIDLDPEKMNEFLQRVKNRKLTNEDYDIIEGMADTITFLSRAVQHKRTSIGRLVRMLFGPPTEKLKKILGKDKGDSDNNGACGPSGTGDDASHKKNKKQKGHGRNGSKMYKAARKILVSHSNLSPGDICPGCQKGKVYDMTDPGVIVRFTGSPPLLATVYQLQKLRCNLCGEIFKPDKAKEVEDEKYDKTARAMIPILKYGSGLPFYRLQKLQDNLGLPLPASTQWDIVKTTADRIHPVYEELVRQAAQGEIIHNDDTTMKILALIKGNAPDQDEPGRRGIFTTGFLSILGDIKIALFMTGRKHAGENMDLLLQERQTDSTPPIQMCDALSRNIPNKFRTILANCLTHGRRKFVDLIDSFPEESRYVIRTLANVYHHDKLAKEQNMSDKERLRFHQENSGPIMDELKTWLHAQINEKRTEPNSGMGKAIFYMLRHWDALTLFLRVEKAPIDNNLCEQALKMIIQHRKNSLFFRTLNGAYTGDLFMSIIHTCNLNNVNPFDYLVILQKYCSDVLKNPHLWLPWNYKSLAASANI